MSFRDGFIVNKIERMTTKQVARKFHMGWTTLEYFIGMGWVDSPVDPADWQGDEIINAYVQVRMVIAYHKGWQACRHGIPIDKHIGTQIPW